MAKLRRLGIYGANLPTKKSKTVEPSDFLIGGIMGLFERKYKVSMLCNNPEEFQEKFGDHITSTYYGNDAVKGFFDNVVGTDGKLFVKSHVGYTGAAYDAVNATATLIDALAANTLQLDAAYQEELDYGAQGNRTGYTITNGDRFSTDILTATLAGDTYVISSSVADVKVGDIIKVIATGGGGATVYKVVTSADESTGRINFSGAFHGAAFPQIGDDVTVPGFRLRVWRKSNTGIVKEVDEELGKNWCTMQDAVTDYFVENIFSTSKWIKATDLDSASAAGSNFPADVVTVTFLASGADGTSPSTSAHWAPNLLSFDDDPVRFLCNPESTDATIQKAIETYCQGRDDKPKVIFNIAENRTKAQLITIGNNYQRSDDVLGVIVANWLKIEDPFASSNIAPSRTVPNVGHVMGAWIRSIGSLGFHYIPAVPSIPLFGIEGIVGDTLLNDDDRTDVADAGVNVIQYVKGSGYLIKNFFTPSTTMEFKFANGILMREYIKISVIDSLSDTENEPNNFARIKASRSAILNFMYRLWAVGSTGNVPEGETFGQSINDDGSSTKAEDHFEVKADLINNPQSAINAGERNLDTWFTYPSPVGSIRISVGLMLR